MITGLTFLIKLADTRKPFGYIVQKQGPAYCQLTRTVINSSQSMLPYIIAVKTLVLRQSRQMLQLRQNIYFPISSLFTHTAASGRQPCRHQQHQSLAGPFAETGDVPAEHVERGFAFDHPFGGELAHAAGRSAQITIATAFGCPFAGEVPMARVIDMAKRAADAQPREVALADTIGVAVPAQVAETVARVREAVGPLPVRVHFHNTRGAGLANVWAAVAAGATVVDASLGGLGGCPFAPGAAGNVATEDVVYMLERSGIATGLALADVVDAAAWFTEVMGRPLPAMVSKAPAFPA